MAYSTDSGSVLEGILDVFAGLLQVRCNLVPLAVGLEILVAAHLAGGLLTSPWACSAAFSALSLALIGGAFPWWFARFFLCPDAICWGAPARLAVAKTLSGDRGRDTHLVPCYPYGPRDTP